MWHKIEDSKAAGNIPGSPTPSLPEPVRTIAGLTAEVVSAPGGVLTSSIKIKGDIHGAEDLYVDGEIRGNTQLTGGRVTVGPHGRIVGDVQAREIVVRGQVQGGLVGRDRIEIGRTGEIQGQFSAARITVEEGARIRAKVEVLRGAEVLRGKDASQRPSAERPAAEPLAQPLAN